MVTVLCINQLIISVAFFSGSTSRLAQFALEQEAVAQEETTTCDEELSLNSLLSPKLIVPS